MCLTTKPGTRATDNFIKRIIPKTLGNTNPSGKGMNENVYAADAIAPTLTTNKGEGIKIAGSLNGKGHDYINRVYDIDGLAPTLPTMQGGGQEPKIVAMRGRNPSNPKSRKAGEPTEQRLEVNKQGISNCLTCVQKDNLLLVPTNTKKGFEVAEDGDSVNYSNPNSKTRRGRVDKGISNTLETQPTQAVYYEEEIRKLTPRECLRLQGFDDSFKIVVSDSQMYKQAGNSMTATVLEMIAERVQMAQSGVSKSGTLMDFL